MLSFHYDERGFNIIREQDQHINNTDYSTIKNWVLNEFQKMKESNPKFGTYVDHNKGKDGEENMYVFLFMNWLIDNQIKLQ